MVPDLPYMTCEVDFLEQESFRDGAHSRPCAVIARCAKSRCRVLGMDLCEDGVER